jgi:hypothetical protein
MFASVRTVDPGALHDPLTMATECDELAANPMRFPDSVEFAPEIFVMVMVPEGPKSPVAVTCTVCGIGVGAVESEQAAIAQTANMLEMMPKRLMVVHRMGLMKRPFVSLRAVR